jgi:RluA family pseudouridine synthase
MTEGCVDVASEHIVRAGDRYLHVVPATQEPDANADIRLLYEDDSILVVDKPAPLPMHPCGRFHRNTLQWILSQVYAPQNPRPAHRLDANTSGIVVFARSRRVAPLLQRQFEPGSSDIVQRRYLAKVHGQPQDDFFECSLPISNAAGPAGSREVDSLNGLAARTEFNVLHRFDDGTALIQATPLTGRTNQIRIHLWSLGHSICGDPMYLPGQKLGDRQTLDPGEEPLCLCAHYLSFQHPTSGERMEFVVDVPGWANTNE